MYGNMLTIHSVNPTGMFSYGMSKDIHLLNKGLVHLYGINDDKGGDSNGSGKSSFFNAICELLFQENPTGVKNDSVINAVWGKGFAGRILITNWNGDHYRITYCRKWKDKLYFADNDNNVEYVGTNLFLDKFEDKMWKDCRGSGMPQTHAKIQEVLGMTYDQFLSIAYMNHRIGSKFLRGTNKDRMEILSSITGISEWDRILQKCRDQRKILNSQIENLDSRIAYESGVVNTLREQFQSFKLSDWTGIISSLEVKVQDQRKLYSLKKDELKVLEDKIFDLTVTRDNSLNKEKINSINSEIEAADQKMTTLQYFLAKPFYAYPDANLLNKQQTLGAKVNELKGELNVTQGSVGSLLELINCTLCGSKITKAKREKISKKIDELNSTIEKFNLEKSTVEQKMQEEQLAQRVVYDEERSKKQSELDQLRNFVTTQMSLLQQEQESYRAYDDQINFLRNNSYVIKNEMSDIQSEGVRLNVQIEQAQNSLKNVEALEQQIVEHERQIEILVAERTEVISQLEIYLWLISNIPYIKLHKMSRGMVEISELCNQYFDEMGDSVRIKISSFEEKAKKRNAADVKDLMKSEVKVEIMDGTKNISPKLYSDGEISKISLAVIRALHELARKSNQGCNVMLMDEIFSFVDSNNSQRIAQSLSSFINRGTVFLTDNSGNLNDLINFDNVWVARKKDGKTTLELN